MDESLLHATDFLPPWAIVTALVISAMLLLVFVKRTVFVQLNRLIDKTPYHIDTLFLSALNTPANLIILGLGIALFQTLDASIGAGNDWLDGNATLISQILVIIALVLFVDRFTSGLLGSYSERSEALRNSRGILQGITRGVVFGIGILVLMGTLGISITPIIASLGITSLAVALALQPTLENLFSGIQLIVDKPIRVGDFIELDSGEQGFVDKIGWRSTWIRMLPNNTVIMPNSVLSQSKIINYFYPEKELSVPVELGVHYNSDLEHVEKVTLEVAREILKSHEWGVTEYDTFVVYTGFGDSSINFTVMLRAKEYFNRFWVRSAFIKALHKRYAEEGINIPYPIRAINLDQEGVPDQLRTSLPAKSEATLVK